MKKIIPFTLLLLAAGSQLIAQNRQQHVPASVERSFSRDYPEARDPQWRRVNGNWHADFNDRGRHDRGEMVAHYDRNGRHLESHIPYDENDVPPAVVRRMQKRYPHARNYSYTRIEHPGVQPLFQVSLTLGSSNKTLYVDDNGRDRKYRVRH